MTKQACAAVCCLGLAACAGGGPLMHPAHVLSPGFVSMGAGVSGQLAVRDIDEGAAPQAPSVGAPEPSNAEKRLEKAAVAPGVSPWVSARVGVAGSNEAGLTYLGRSVRLDGRHAFDLGNAALSIGLGGSLVLPARQGASEETKGVYGGGFDVPILLGVTSAADVYSLWIGPRGGVELLRGHLDDAVVSGSTLAPGDLEATHAFFGGVLGARAGFRHVHATVELNAAYHHASGTIGGAPVTLDQVTITPSGGLTVSF